MPGTTKLTNELYCNCLAAGGQDKSSIKKHMCHTWITCLSLPALLEALQQKSWTHVAHYNPNLFRLSVSMSRHYRDVKLFWSRQSSHRRHLIQMVNHQRLHSLPFCTLISQDSFLTYLQAIPHRLQLQLEQPISIISFHLTLNMTQHSSSWTIDCLKTYHSWSSPVRSEQSGPLHLADFIQHFAKKTEVRLP